MNHTVSAKLLIIFSIFAYFFTFTISLQTIIPGHIAFWYDPARDLLLALDNLQKPTLIGPPAGIPGIFYGPYWIWLLSFGLLFAKDPRIVATIVLLIPYFTLFPLLLWGFSKHWGVLTVTMLGILFLINFNGYTTQLWNPHLGPLFFLSAVYFLASSRLGMKTRTDITKLFIAGIATGLLVNFHISFGIGAIAGLSLFLITEAVYVVMRSKKKERRRKIVTCIFGLVVFYTGVFLMYVPFFIFEFRHGFQQLQAALRALLNPFAVVGVKGLTDDLILRHFTDVFYRLTSLSNQFVILFAVLVVSHGIYALYKKNKIALSDFNRRIVSLVLFSTITVLFFYLTSKNPVWEYHFIGVEILFLLFLGLLIRWLPLVRLFIFLAVVYLVVVHFQEMMNAFQKPHTISGTLAAKEQVVHLVINDARGDYVVSVYNPAIYTYDYDYLFLWKDQKEVTGNLSEISDKKYPAYLVIPQTDDGIRQDFINAQTKGMRVRKVKEWSTSDNTTIVKLDLIP